MKKQSNEKIGVFEKVAYGGGDLASNLILVLSSTFVTFFYTDALGLNPAIIGSIMMFSRIFDGISDILMGFVMDHTKSKHGKARPWLLWLALPIGISLILMFCVPQMGDFGKYVYIAITYNLVTTVLYTAINIPYGALTSLMSRDQDERMVINIFRMTMAQIGSLLINAFTLPLVNTLGGSIHQKSWILASVIYGLIAMALFLMCFFKTKERVKVANIQPVEKKLSFVSSLKICIKNDQWLILVAIWVTMSFGMAMGMGVGTYYAKYILGNENLAGFLMAISILPVVLIMPLLPQVIRKIGKCKVAIIGGIIGTIGQLMMAINPTSFIWLVVCSVIKGIGQAATAGTMFAMIADTIEYGHWKTGVRTEGMLYSSTTFGAKIGAGVGGAAAMAILGAAGYNGLLATQGAEVLISLKALYIYVPAVFLAIMTGLYFFYKLDKIYPQVIKELTEKENIK